MNGHTSARPRRLDELAATAFALLGATLLCIACSDESPANAPAVPAKVELPPPTQLRVHTLSIQNVALDGLKGAGYVNLHDGLVYGGADAAAHAAQLDFRHQYRGADIQNRRSLENLATRSRWDSLGLFAEITPTESRILSTSLGAADFDRIENREDLLRSFDFQKVLARKANAYRRAYLSDSYDTPLALVFAFVDKDGKRGLFKVVDAEAGPVDSTPVGTLTIDVKVEE